MSIAYPSHARNDYARTLKNVANLKNNFFIICLQNINKNIVD